ncbi:dihydrolipoyl dehydrogenase family protein [Acidimangrovimonas pyrenivorans]|uniref:Dihydrolipoyl dehydrogenase family protein n=1 Tax=Acidimangrovimonas pyrenivorans TaxID=2030798 RepID=A0ABV7AHX0_9RHOB
MRAFRADICVIGAGSGGLSVAAGAAQMGARVVLIEAGEMGGDCLNTGCVPSKALIAAAGRAQATREGGLGVAGTEPQVDFAAVMAHVKTTIAAIAPHDSQQRFEGLGVTVLRDFARFTGPDTVEAGGTRVTARRFVLATGSRPLVPPIPGLDGVPYLTNETVFELSELPAHLLVLGGGPIGIELAQAFRRLGAGVTVVEAARALGREDPELAAAVLENLRQEGVEIVEGARATEVRGQAGALELVTESGRAISGSHLLVAVGRQPAIAGLGLEAAGIATETGAVKTGRDLRTTNRRVYAIGDVAGRGAFTHLAGYHAGLILRPMLFALPARLRDDHVPRVTYADPELAQVGLTEAEARARYGDGIEVLRAPFAANDRALAEGRTEGLAKVIVRRGRPVGAGIAGAGAGELIGLWALALSRRDKLSAIAGMILPYPTQSEVSKRAAGAYFSPRLFDSALVKRVVRLVQRRLP